MRSSPVAPAPLPENKKSQGGNGGGSRTNKSFPNQAKEVSTSTSSSSNERTMNHAVRVVSTIEPPPPLETSSLSMEDGKLSTDEEAGFHGHSDAKGDDDDHSFDDDPYTYSDDSASLNDSYFLQPSHDHGFGSSSGGIFGLISDTESEKDPLEVPADTGFSIDNVILTLSPNEKRRGRQIRFFGRRNTYERRDGSTSVSSPIDEEEPISESTSLLHDKENRLFNNHTGVITSAHQGMSSASSYKNRQERRRRKLRKQQRNLRLQQQHKQQQQQKQQERERAVTQIRGQPQPATQTDRFWLVLFIMQLLYVAFCALKYGFSLKGSSITTVVAPGKTLPSITGMDDTRKPDSVPVGKILNRDQSANTSSSSQFPFDFDLGPETALSAVSSQTVITADSDSKIEHLQDDDDVHPAMPDTRHPNPRSNSNSQIHKSSTITSSSSSRTTTTMTTKMDGSSVIVVENAPFTVDYQNVLSLLLISGLYACITSYLTFAFMLMVARSLIPIMLSFTILLLLCWGVIGLTVTTYGGSAISIVGFSMSALSLAYTLINWNRIPFCSTNLYIAICALRSSVMILLTGVMSLFVALFWLFLWSIAMMGILNMGNGTDCAMWDECETHIVIRNGRLMELGMLLFSLYWTTMVIKNIVRVTVADAVGCWWMKSDGTVLEPFVRACTTSLGAICFGSLVAFPAQSLCVLGGCICWASGGVSSLSVHWAATLTKRMSTSSQYNTTDSLEQDKFAKEQEEIANAVAKKIAQEKNCFRRCGRQLQACNRWSYTYVGMYNYSFMEGGKKAIELFETREWMEIVRDNLIQNILVMASIIIGGSSAMVAVLVEEVDGYTFTSLNKPIITSFWIGFLLGFVLSNILLLGVVGSAVNTILVCFAAEPFQFDRNYPRLSREMREVWSQQVWEPEPEN